MKQQDYKFFQGHGYLPLGKILTAEGGSQLHRNL